MPVPDETRRLGARWTLLRASRDPTYAGVGSTVRVALLRRFASDLLRLLLAQQLVDQGPAPLGVVQDGAWRPGITSRCALGISAAARLPINGPPYGSSSPQIISTGAAIC